LLATKRETKLGLPQTSGYARDWVLGDRVHTESDVFVEVSTLEEYENIDKRHQTRVQIEAPKAVVACQIKCCTTHVSNISSKGICLSNLPQKMIKEGSNKFRVIFRSREREYAMFVQPRWSKLGDNGFKIGAEILTIPAGWEGFVNEFCQPSLAKAA
jgi:hypothetical protein